MKKWIFLSLCFIGFSSGAMEPKDKQQPTYTITGFKCPKDDAQCEKELQRLAHETVKSREAALKNRGAIVKEAIVNSKKLQAFDMHKDDLRPGPMNPMHHGHPYKEVALDRDTRCDVYSEINKVDGHGNITFLGSATCHKKAHLKDYPTLSAAVAKAGHLDMWVYEHGVVPYTPPFKEALGTVHLEADEPLGEFDLSKFKGAHYSIMPWRGAPLTGAQHLALNAYKLAHSQKELNATLKQIFHEHPQEFEPTAQTVTEKMQNIWNRLTRKAYWWELPTAKKEYRKLIDHKETTLPFDDSPKTPLEYALNTPENKQIILDILLKEGTREDAQRQKSDVWVAF